MNSVKFTKTSLLSIPIPENGKRVEYYDTELKGLRLRVTPKGKKSFCVAVKVDGRFFRSGLGEFPIVTVEQAREGAYRFLNEVATTRRNPNERRREEKKKTVTLSEALNEYIASRSASGRIKDSTRDKYIDTLQNYSGDWMGMQLASLTRDLVEVRHQTITERGIWFGGPSRRKAKGSKAQADLWGRVLRAVYKYAYDSYRDKSGGRLLPDPPTSILSTKRLWNGNTRKSTRIRNSDLGRWLDSVDTVRKRAEYLREDITLAICDCVDVALFTGLRRSEIFGLEWDRVNLQGRYFWIDKTKNGNPLELPITDTLHTIFTRRQSLRCGDSSYVFPSSRGGVISNVYPVISMITQETTQGGLMPAISFSFHDARRTFGSVAELVGIGPYALKRLMNHKTMRSADVTQGYLYYSSDELLEPARKVEQAILEHAGRSEKKNGLESQLNTLIGVMNDEERRRFLFDILNKLPEVKKA